MTEFEKNLEYNPQSVTAHLNLAKIYFAQRKLNLASEHLQRAAKIDPNSYDTCMTAGDMLMNLQDFPNAARMFRRAVQLKRDASRAYNALGVALAAQQLYPEAIYNFGRATDLDPTYDDARKNLQAAQAERSRREAAATQP